MFWRMDFITASKLFLFLLLIFISILLLVNLAKIIKNALHPKLIRNLMLVILLSILHLCDPLLTFQHDYNYRWAKWLHMDGDIHKNPGPKTEHFRFSHWNVNSIPDYNFSRLTLVESYNALYDFHILAISESALKPNILNSEIEIPAYTPIRSDLTGSDTHGGVLLYHKQNLSVKHRVDLCTPSYTLVLELSINRKKVFFVHSYRKFGQTKQEANIFTKL